MDSILNYIKKTLGIHETSNDFDLDIIMHINTAFNTLTQLGVGPEYFTITGPDAVWTDFTSNKAELEAVKSYIYFRTRLAFDPPSSSFVLESIKRQINELEWRLNVQAESKKTVK